MKTLNQHQSGAERLAIQGLASFPWQRIESELKTIYEKVNYKSYVAKNSLHFLLRRNY